MSFQKSPEERISSHMNKDHKLSIEDYLVSYGHVDIAKVKSFSMTHIDTESLTITFRLKDTDLNLEKIIPFDPPMKSLSDARDRLGSMAKDAAAQRGFSHIQINEYVYPGTSGVLAHFLIHSALFVGFFPALFNNRLFSAFIKQPVIDWLVRHAFKIELLAILIHVAEVYFILMPLAQYYRVEDFRLEWYIAGIIEGFPAIRRLKQLVADKTHTSKPKSA